MSQLNDSVTELANFWSELHRENETLATELESLLGTETTNQLMTYIQEIEDYNEEIDVDSLINDMEEARYQIDNIESQIHDALSAIDDAVMNAEDLR